MTSEVGMTAFNINEGLFDVSAKEKTLCLNY
jgi:hypothetical protein